MSEHLMAMEAVRPLVDYLLHLKLRFASGEKIEPGPLRNELIRQINEMERRLVQLPIPGLHKRFETIKYIFAALSDEIIYYSGWEYSDVWLQQPLESEILKAAIAGEHFYELLEQEGLNDSLMAELFYTCLVLGFGRDRPDYNDLKQRLYKLLPGTLPEDERHLSPGAEKAVRGGTTQLPPMFGIMTLIAVILVSTTLYIFASHMLWNHAADFLHEISNRLLTKGY